jgi:hypothetical protein
VNDAATNTLLVDVLAAAGVTKPVWLGGREWVQDENATSQWTWLSSDPRGEMRPADDVIATTDHGVTALSAGKYWGNGGQPTAPRPDREPRCTALAPISGEWTTPNCTERLAGFIVEYARPRRYQFGASHYELLPTKLDWYTAVRTSASYAYKGQPGHLVTVDSAAEGAFVASLVRNTWVGAKLEGVGKWEWMAGPEAGTVFWDATQTPPGVAGTYAGWAAGQPLVAATSAVRAYCASQHQAPLVQPGEGGGAATTSWVSGWYATGCSSSFWSVVEFEMPSELAIVYLDAAEHVPGVAVADGGAGDRVWRDVSGLGNDATVLGGGAGVVFDRSSRTFHFDGARTSDDDASIFEVDFDIGPKAFPQLSIEVWFKVDEACDFAQTKSWVVGQDDGGFDRAVILADGRFNGVGSGVGRVYDTGLGYPGKGVWHHIVAVFDYGAPLASYVALNGVVGTKVTEQAHSEGLPQFSIGGIRKFSGHGLVGNLAAVKIYKSALAEAEVATAYELFLERYGELPSAEGGEGTTAVATFQIHSRPVASLRTDLDAAVEGTDRHAAAFADASGKGSWALYSGPAEPLADRAALRPLGYNAADTIHGVVLPGSWVDFGATSPFKLPGVSTGPLVGGAGEGAPGPDEVAVHPGNPATDPAHSRLVVRWTAGASDWYDLTGSIRDLGLIGDGVTLSASWMLGGVPTTERLGLVKRDVQAFQYRLFVAKGGIVDLLVGAHGDFYGDHAALTLVVSKAKNFSPFVLGPTTAVSPAGAQVLGWAEAVSLAGAGFTSGEGNVAAVSERVAPLGADTRSLKIVKNAAAGAPYCWLGLWTNVSCGETVVMSAWLMFEGVGVPPRGTGNLGFKHHADDGSSAGDGPIDDTWLEGMVAGEWKFVESRWTAGYTTGGEGASNWPNGDHLLLIFDTAPPGTVVYVTDFRVTKILAESEANLGTESTQTDVTPDGFYVGGSHFNVDLTSAVVNEPHGTVRTSFSDDVPAAANDPRSIQFEVLKPGPFAWYGFKTAICEGDLVQFSVWLKFVGAVPAYDRAHTDGAGGIGLKHHSGSDPAAQDSAGDAMIYTDFLDGMAADEWVLVTKTWHADYSEADLLLLIMDSAPAGTVGRFADLRVTKLVNTPVLFFRGSGDYVRFSEAEGLPAGDAPYTVEAWVQPHAHLANGIVGWGVGDAAATTSGATTLSLGPNGQVTHGWGGGVPELVVANAAGSWDPAVGLDDGKWHHIAATYDGTTRRLFVNGVERKSDRPGVPHAAASANLRIGSVGGRQYFDGGIAEVKIWELARTAAEINHYMTVQIDTDVAGLVGYWRLNDGGSTARDSSPRRMDGYVVGATYNMRTSPPPLAAGFADFVVDSDSPTGVTIVGDWVAVAGDGGAFAGDHYLTDGNRGKGRGLVRFVVNVPAAGSYDVLMAFPADPRNAPAVPVTVVHQSGKSTVLVDQTAAAAAGWLLLGTYKFKAGPALITVSNEGTTGIVTVDAFKLSATNRPLDELPTAAGAGGWAAGCQSATTSWIGGDFAYAMLPGTLPSQAITFSVKAANDAHVGLVAGPAEAPSMYEIVLGGWANTQSVIRNSHQGANRVVKATPGILAANEWRSFWVAFNGGEVVVGTGVAVGAAGTELMRWKDPNPMVVDHVGVGTGFNAGGTWEVCAVTDAGASTGGPPTNGLACGANEFAATHDGAPQCRPLRSCAAGSWESTPPTATADRECTACEPGTSDTDANPATPCVGCTPGHFVPAGAVGPCTPQFSCPKGTTDDDRDAATACVACELGKFAPTIGMAGQCRQQLARCAAGAEEDPARPPSAVADRTCTPCVVGQTFNAAAGGACRAVRECPGGQGQQQAPTLVSDRTCSTTAADACPPGNVRTQAAACSPCAAGTTDDDFDPSTPCATCSGGGLHVPAGSAGPCAGFACPAGTYGAAADAACVPCSWMSEFQPKPGQTFCNAVTSCGAGYETDLARWQAIGATADRPCRGCVLGVTFKPTAGTAPCMPVTSVCSAGFDEAAPPTLTSDRSCAACRAGTFRDVFADATAKCQPWRPCPPGFVAKSAPSATRDTVCTKFEEPTWAPASVGSMVGSLKVSDPVKAEALRVLLTLGVSATDGAEALARVDQREFFSRVAAAAAMDPAAIKVLEGELFEVVCESTGGCDGGGGGGGGGGDNSGSRKGSGAEGNGIWVAAVVSVVAVGMVAGAVVFKRKTNAKKTLYAVAGPDDDDDEALLEVDA